MFYRGAKFNLHGKYFYKFSSTFLNSSALYINFATLNIACFDFDIIKLSNLFMFGQWQKYGLKNFLLNSAKSGHTSKKWYSFSIFDILQHLQILSAPAIFSYLPRSICRSCEESLKRVNATLYFLFAMKSK